MENEHHNAWRLLLANQQLLVSRIDRKLREAGKIPLVWYDVLHALSSCPGGRCRQQELGRCLVLTKSGVSRIVTTLERKALVRRESCDTDGRGVFVELTRKGKSALDAAWLVYRDGIEQEFAAHLSHVEAKRLSAILEKLHKSASGPDIESIG